MLLQFTINHAAEAVAVVVGPAAVDLTGVTSAVDIGGSDAELLAVCSHVIPSCTGCSRTVKHVLNFARVKVRPVLGYDIHLMVSNDNGRKRTRAECRDPLARAGFELRGEQPLPLGMARWFAVAGNA